MTEDVLLTEARREEEVDRCVVCGVKSVDDRCEELRFARVSVIAGCSILSMTGKERVREGHGRRRCDELLG